MDVKWLVIGAGYTGSRLAARLASDGHEVVVTRRTAGDGVLAFDLAAPAPLPAADVLVCTAPPGADPGAELRGLVAPRIIYLSSTAVYGPGGGRWVDEHWPVAPTTRAGRARAAAEAALTGNAIALRVAGIHGPGRGIVERLRSGSYRIVGDGRAHVSRIHVEDLVEAIVRAGTSAVAGAINIADDDPAPIGEVADAIAAHLGLPPPPRVPIDAVDPELAGMLAADRRIANTRMKQALGVALRYPSWRTLIASG